MSYDIWSFVGTKPQMSVTYEKVRNTNKPECALNVNN